MQKCFLHGKLCKKVFQPSLSRTCHYKGKSSYGTVSGSTVCPFTLKTIGIYSPTFIICAQVVFATLIFQNLPLKGKIYLRLYGDLLRYLIWLDYVLIHHKEKFIWECIGTSYATLSGSIVCPFTLKSIGSYSPTIIICWKVFFASLTFQNLPLKGKIYLRMYRDLLWYLIWLYCVPIHFKNHWDLFFDIYYLC